MTIIYNVNTGKYLGITSDSIEQVEANIEVGDLILDTDIINIHDYTIVNGVMVAKVLDNSKEIKLDLVNEILVTTTSGKVFDGDEKSQDRMARAINIATITGLLTTQWKLADNSIVSITLDELKEALSLAGQEMSRIWLEQ